MENLLRVHHKYEVGDIHEGEDVAERDRDNAEDAEARKRDAAESLMRVGCRRRGAPL